MQRSPAASAVSSPCSILRRGPAIVIAITMLSAILLTPRPARAGSPGEPPHVPGQLIVGYRPGTTLTERAAIRSDLGADVIETLPVRRVELLDVSEAGTVSQVQDELEQEAEVAFAEPNGIWSIDATTPNDPLYPQQWGLDNTGQVIGGIPGSPDADIDAPEAWDTTTGDPAVVVAVVDTGVAYDHPDLAPTIWTNLGESGDGRDSNGVDDDGNGLIDDWRGWDWVGRDNDPYDLHYHGTHVAGTIAAQGNDGAGVTGVVWDGTIMPLRVLNAAGSGTWADLASAFAYAGREGADIVNASLSGSSGSTAVAQAIADSPETLFVFAAGNNGRNTDQSPAYPCAYPHPNIICVAATGSDDLKASFSNYGATTVDLAAPGVNVLSDSPTPRVHDTQSFLDDFETPLAGRWITGGTGNAWDLTTAMSSSPTTSLTDSPGRDYGANVNSWAQIQDPLTLPGTNCEFRYRVRADINTGDILYLEAATTEAGPWSVLSFVSGATAGQFDPRYQSLSSYSGDVYLRFRMLSGATTFADGVYIDDIDVGCGPPATDATRLLSGTSMATPHVAGAAALVLSRNPGATTAQLKNAILGSAQPIPGLAGITVTGGRLRLDFDPPQTFIDDGPPPSTGATSAVIDFHASQGNSTFECDLDGGGYWPCMSPATYENLAGGPHLFTVRATDAMGNVDTTPATHAWTVDTSPPETLIDTAPSDPSNVANATFEFSSSEPGSTFSCLLDGIPVVGNCTSPRLFGGLTPGPHLFSVRATDAAGNADPTPATHTWTITLAPGDDLPPDTSIDAAPPAATGATSADFAFSSSDWGSTFSCSLDGAAFSACTSPTTLTDLSDGPHTFAVRAKDPAGNTDQSPATHTWRVDHVAPETTIVAGPPVITPSGTAPFQLASTEPDSTFLCDLDGYGGAFLPCPAAQTYTNLSEGLHLLMVVATDPSGNTDPSAALYAWRIDLTAPDTTITDAPSGTVSVRHATFSFTSTEDGTAFRCALDGGPAADCSSPRTYGGLADGPHTFAVRAVDDAGNVDPVAATAAWEVDAGEDDGTPPDTVIQVGPPDPSASAAATFAFSATEGGATFACSLDGADPEPCDGGLAMYEGLADGAHDFSVAATDAFGNTDPTPGTHQWTIDTVAPTTTIDSGPAAVVSPRRTWSSSSAHRRRVSASAARSMANRSPRVRRRSR